MDQAEHQQSRAKEDWSPFLKKKRAGGVHGLSSDLFFFNFFFDDFLFF